MTRASSLLLMAGLAMACASQTPEPAEDAPRRQTERSEVAQLPSPPDRSQIAPGLPICVGRASEQATLTEEQRGRMRISPDGQWMVIPCDDVTDNEAFRAASTQPEPPR